MDRSALEEVARLIRARNTIDAEVAAITGRPLVAGHLGEWIASEIFDIELEASAVAKAIDGRFRSGPLVGLTVNVKWYGKLEGILDMSEDPTLDVYLVMAGSRGKAGSSRGTTRPLSIESVHLFRADELLANARQRAVKIGVATSIRSETWRAAEIFPSAANPVYELSDQQRELLALFSGGV